MRILAVLASSLVALAGCSPAAEPEPTQAEGAPAQGVVPTAFVGVWSSDGCDKPAVGIGARDIHHFYMAAPAALTSVEASNDGGLVVVWSDEGVATTERFQLTDGKLDHVATTTAAERDDWISDPMIRCPDGTPMS